MGSRVHFSLEEKNTDREEPSYHWSQSTRFDHIDMFTTFFFSGHFGIFLK